MWDLLLFGKKDAFPTVQHLSEAASVAKELSRRQSMQRGTILCQASQVNEVVCFSARKIGREFVVVTEHVIERCLCFRAPLFVVRNHRYGSYCGIARSSRGGITACDARGGWLSGSCAPSGPCLAIHGLNCKLTYSSTPLPPWLVITSLTAKGKIRGEGLL